MNQLIEGLNSPEMAALDVAAGLTVLGVQCALGVGLWLVNRRAKAALAAEERRLHEAALGDREVVIDYTTIFDGFQDIFHLASRKMAELFSNRILRQQIDEAQNHDDAAELMDERVNVGLLGLARPKQALVILKSAVSELIARAPEARRRLAAIRSRYCSEHAAYAAVFLRKTTWLESGVRKYGGLRVTVVGLGLLEQILDGLNGPEDWFAGVRARELDDPNTLDRALLLKEVALRWQHEMRNNMASEERRIMLFKI